MDYMFALVLVLSILFVFTLYFCIKFALIIIRMQNAIEYSLDVIDQKYDSFSIILEIPIFYNSEEVKRAINDLEGARNSLLDIEISQLKKKFDAMTTSLADSDI